MVNERFLKIIESNKPLKPDQEAFIINICEKYPYFTKPYLCLLNNNPNLFKPEIWQKANLIKKINVEAEKCEDEDNFVANTNLLDLVKLQKKQIEIYIAKYSSSVQNI